MSKKRHKINKFANYRNIIVRNSPAFDRHVFVSSQDRSSMVFDVMCMINTQIRWQDPCWSLCKLRTSFGSPPLPLLVFALFYFVFEDNFPSTSPCGAYLEGRFNGGFFALPAWEAYIWRGLFPEFYGILKEISENDCEFERFFCSQVRLRRKLYLEKEKWEIVLICMNCKR